jgi:hypothetical protein
MNGNVRRRVSARVIWTFILAAALAVIPPALYHDLIYARFFLEDTAKEIANLYLSGAQWIHLGAIAAIWLLNLVFFIINQKKGDCGRILYGRTTLQNILNVLLIFLSVAAMIGYRYMISAEAWIGVLFGTANSIKAIVWMPYYIFLASGFFLWCFCRRAAPATNCPVTCKLAKWFDDKMKRAERTR